MTNTIKKLTQKDVPTSSKREPAPSQVPARKSRRTKLPTPVSGAAPLAKSSKRDQLAAMLLRDEGATIDQMIDGLGWLPHTVRAALTGLKKLGYVIDSDKIDGLRTYRAVAPK
ncbi:MAG: DUF3489 domain-containing protein [Salinibacterium sp.]|nr:DUF3489 domain-containing protein [Salinibacterium sp.]